MACNALIERYRGVLLANDEFVEVRIWKDLDAISKHEIIAPPLTLEAIITFNTLFEIFVSTTIT